MTNRSGLEANRQVVMGGFLMGGAQLTGEPLRLHLSDFQLDSLRQEHLALLISQLPREDVVARWGKIQLGGEGRSSGMKRLIAALAEENIHTVAGVLLSRFGDWSSIGQHRFVGAMTIVEFKEFLNSTGASLKNWRLYAAENHNRLRDLGENVGLGEITPWQRAETVFGIE